MFNSLFSVVKRNILRIKIVLIWIKKHVLFLCVYMWRFFVCWQEKDNTVKNCNNITEGRWYIIKHILNRVICQISKFISLVKMIFTSAWRPRWISLPSGNKFGYLTSPYLISVYNWTVLEKLTINFHASTFFLNFHECVSTSGN